MRRGIAAAVLAGLIGGGLAGVAGADQVDLGVRGGYMKLGDGDGALTGGAFLRKDYHEIIFFEGAVLYHVESAGDVDVEMIPIQLSAMLFLLGRDEAFCPYIGGGAGFYIVRTTSPAIAGDTEYDFGWHIGLGLDWAFHRKMFLEADVRYVWLDVDTEGRTYADTLSEFDNWMASLGFGFRIW